jgi:hypothetical protein
MLESGTSGSVGGEGGNILVYPARSPIAVIIDRFAGDRQLFSVYGRDTYCPVESLAFILTAADNRSGSMARKTVDLSEWPLIKRQPQVPSKLKVAGSIPAGVAKKSTHKSRYSKSFRERIECRAELPIRDKAEQNGSNAHESGAKAYEKSHDFC